MIYLRRCYAIECAVLYFDITSLHFIFKAFKIQYILALFAGDIFKMYYYGSTEDTAHHTHTNTVAQIRELTAGILRPLYYARIYLYFASAYGIGFDTDYSVKIWICP